MAALTCPNCSAILKTKDPVPAGKKVKCPKCATVFESPAEEQPAEAPPPPPPPENEFAGLGGGEVEKPAKKGKAKPKATAESSKDGDESPKKKDETPKKSNTGLIIGIVVGVLLLCCCLPSCGFGFVNFSGLAMFGMTSVKDKRSPEDINAEIIEKAMKQK
jgi:predicted Zn finger-like uncharacterized protein